MTSLAYIGIRLLALYLFGTALPQLPGLWRSWSHTSSEMGTPYFVCLILLVMAFQIAVPVLIWIYAKPIARAFKFDAEEQISQGSEQALVPVGIVIIGIGLLARAIPSAIWLAAAFSWLHLVGQNFPGKELGPTVISFVDPVAQALLGWALIKWRAKIVPFVESVPWKKE